MPVRQNCPSIEPVRPQSFSDVPQKPKNADTAASSKKPPRKKIKPDAFEIAATEDVNADYATLVKRMRLWQEFLAAAYGFNLKIDYAQPLFVKPEKIEKTDEPAVLIQKNAINERESIANDKKPEVFLTKYMTDIFAVKGSSVYSVDRVDVKPQDLIQDVAVLNCAYQNILLRYEHEKNTFSVTGLKGDLSSQRAKDDEIFTNNSLFEITKAALILAQSAKAAGWASVNFGNTTDPAKRYALQVACQYVGIDCSSEKVDLKALPDTFHHEKLEYIIKNSIDEFLPSMDQQIWPDETPQQVDIDIDIDDLDAAYAGQNHTQQPQRVL